MEKKDALMHFVVLQLLLVFISYLLFCTFITTDHSRHILNNSIKLHLNILRGSMREA